jgi:hypothetical protein
MARSARSSGIKKNKAVLKKRVFGPVETARNERLSAKLLELANAPKEKMEVEVEKPEESKATEGATEGMLHAFSAWEHKNKFNLASIRPEWTLPCSRSNISFCLEL